MFNIESAEVVDVRAPRGSRSPGPPLGGEAYVGICGIDPEGQVSRRGEARERRQVGLADGQQSDLVQAFGEGRHARGVVDRELALGVGRRHHVERADETTTTLAHGQVETAGRNASVDDPVEFRID